jgi:hypothetical protein
MPNYAEIAPFFPPNRRKKERQDETQFTTKIGGKPSLCPSYFAL